MILSCDIRNVKDPDAADDVQVDSLIFDFLQYKEISNENSITEIIEYQCTY